MTGGWRARLRRLRCALLGHGPFRHEKDFEDPETGYSRHAIISEAWVRCLGCYQILRVPLVLARDLASSDDPKIRAAIEQSRIASVSVAVTEQSRPGWINRLRRLWRPW